MASSSIVADGEDLTEFALCWLGQLSRVFVDFDRLAFTIPLVLGFVFFLLDPRDRAQPWISNLSRVPAETSWSILRVWRE